MLTLLGSRRSGQTSLGAPVAAGRPRRGLARALAKLVLVLPVAAAVIGCSANGDVDELASSVIFNIESFEVQSVPFGDMITSGGTILDDAVTFELSAVLKAPITTNPQVTAPDLQIIALDHYEVTFTRTDGGTAVPPGFTRGITGVVRLSEPGTQQVNVTTLSNIVIAPSTTKAQPPLSFLISPGSEPSTNFTNIQVNARIQFFGTTTGGDPVTVVGNIGINFADYGDDNS